jgi:hypothetical protein
MNPIPIDKISKSDVIWNVSNPDLVNQKAKKYFIQIYRSTRPTKKYMARNATGQWIHFGDIKYSDHTKYPDDEEKRNKFLKRNARWAKAFPLTSAWLSWYILWD